MLALIATAVAGLAPPDVLVLYSSEDVVALEVARAYAASRELEDRQLCAVGEGLDPSAASVSWEDFVSGIRDPFETCLAAQPDPDDIDVLVLVRGLPYRVTLPTFVASLEAVLQVGHVQSFGEELAGQGQAANYQGTSYASISNPTFIGDWDGALAQFDVGRSYREIYTASLTLVNEESWPVGFTRAEAGRADVWNFNGELFLVSRLDGFDHDDALSLVERGLSADETFPTAEILCMYGADEARGARDDECEFVTRMLSEEGFEATWLDTFDSALEGHEVAAYFTGAASLTGAIDGQTYAPGAIVDNVTSYGAHPNNFACSDEGDCPESEQQTSIARFVRAGATGVHGTVAEPLNNVFPHASALLLYSHGYTLGESLLFSQPATYWQNLLLGDPLTVPYGERPTVSMSEAGGVVTVVGEHPDGISGLTVYRDGVRITEGDGETVEVELDESIGTEVELYAVARSGPVEVGTTDWPAGVVTANPEIAGWSSAVVVVSEVSDTGDTGEEQGPPPEDCEGCSATGASFSWLGLLLLVRRRRR